LNRKTGGEVSSLPRTVTATPRSENNPPAVVPTSVRQIRILPRNLQLDPNERLPSEGSWPILSPGNTEGWRVADPDAIKIQDGYIVLSSGINGNLLITRRANYKKCSITARLVASQGTEAFLALRVVRGPDGWGGVTSRVSADATDVRAGLQSLDFQLPEQGKVPQGNMVRLGRLATDKPISIRFEIDDRNASRVLINGIPMSSIAHNGPRPTDEIEGAVGLFVKSGTLKLAMIRVEPL